MRRGEVFDLGLPDPGGQGPTGDKYDRGVPSVISSFLSSLDVVQPDIITRHEKVMLPFVLCACVYGGISSESSNTHQ